jgi:hypothetical protein
VVRVPLTRTARASTRVSDSHPQQAQMPGIDSLRAETAIRTLGNLVWAPQLPRETRKARRSSFDFIMLIRVSIP